MKKIVLITAILSSVSFLYAQTLDDALRYSLNNYNSTARFAGVAGAFAPLGADLSQASINPAGIAEFRKSEIAFTLNSNGVKNEATIDGSTTNENINKIGLSNLAAVFHYDPPSFNVRTFNLAIGFNQLTNFNETVVYQGRGSGTIVERFLELAQNNTPDELGAFEAGPAFDAGAIFDFDDDQTYDSDFEFLDAPVDRAETITRSGTLNEIFIAVGSNINNKFSWGATLGFPFANFNETRSYNETDGNNSIDFFDQIAFTQNLSTTGVGINFKAGVIYKLNKKLRLGASIHSPSYFFLKDNFDTRVDYAFTADNVSEQFNGESPLSEFEYNFQTPWRAIAGLGYIYSFGDIKGFLSGEVEYVDYSAAKFDLTANSDDPIDIFFEEDLNNEITDNFTSTVNVRVGTELAYQKYRARIGVALPKTPFQSDIALKLDPSYSLGIGYRENKFYIDAAYTIRASSGNYSPYRILDANREPLVDINTNIGLASLTVGFKL